MTIQILVNASGMEMTPHLKEYVEKKINKLSKILENIDEARVELRYDGSLRSDSDKHVAQMTVRGRDLLLRAEERSNDIYTSVDTALDKLHRRVDKFKGKRLRGRVDPGPLKGGAMEPEAQESASDRPIVRRKKFILEPMSELEAIEQMHMLGHEDFFLFQNVRTAAVNVIYKRRDGTFGILEPDIR
ncbi:MAG: ribosome-associated translation inhibitor RaiA [Anaerolineales bacterium]|nr:ribosome-associated translation inhibitor RaiA [Anaerolineales bacterium]